MNIVDALLIIIVSTWTIIITIMVIKLLIRKITLPFEKTSRSIAIGVYVLLLIAIWGSIINIWENHMGMFAMFVGNAIFGIIIYNYITWLQGKYLYSKINKIKMDINKMIKNKKNGNTINKN